MPTESNRPTNVVCMTMSNPDQQKLDLASVFPAPGDARRPPEWWGRGLLYTAIAVFVSIFVWQSWGKVSFVVLNVVVSMFLALAIEPLVIRLVRHSWRRGLAAGFIITMLFILMAALLALFGNMFVQQMISMVSGMPVLYEQASDLVSKYSSFSLPEIENLGDEILKNLKSSWVTDFAGQALNTTIGLMTFLLNFITVVMVTYYISAAGPKMIRSICKWMGPQTQKRFLLGWTIVQQQISGFLFSRSILAALNAICMAIFMIIIHVPNWLPLALFCGIVSQFIPTVGTYIGGALPVIFAWGSNGLWSAVAVLVFIIVYQQIENTILSPKISERTMNINPAIAFLAVLVLGALFGALGAFLALPVTASLQAMFKVYTKQYPLVESELMEDPKPIKKSRVVEGAETFSERVIRQVGDRMPRAIRGSTSKVPPSDDEYQDLKRQLFAGEHTAQELDESLTVAIPKGVLRDKDRVDHGADDEHIVRKADIDTNQQTTDHADTDESKGQDLAGADSGSDTHTNAHDEQNPESFTPETQTSQTPKSKPSRQGKKHHDDNDGGSGSPRSRWR